MLEIFRVQEADSLRVMPAELRRVVTAILESAGVETSDAALAADVLVSADVRGVDSHGVSNMLRIYIQRIQQGSVSPDPSGKSYKRQPPPRGWIATAASASSWRLRRWQ